MSKTELFAVRRGKVLKDTVHNDARLNLVRGSETVELAMYHLYTNPESRKFFEKLPDDDRLEEMIAEYAEKFESERNAGTGTGVTAADKVLNDAKDEAAEIVAKAQNEAKTIIGDAEQTAIEKSEEIIAEAKKVAAEIVAKAQNEAKTVKTPDKVAKKTAANAEPDPILK